MPQLFWSLTAAPRFNSKDRICGQYKVEKIVNEDSRSQVVHAKTGTNTQRTIKIITRARVQEVDVTDEIEWLHNTRLCRDEFVRYIEHKSDIRYFYLIFERRPRTLKHVLSDNTIHLSRRHVIEMTQQIIQATLYLNNHSIFDMDLCPENIEVSDENMTEWYYSRGDGGFRSRNVLKSSQIRIAYYGKAGKNPSQATFSERYKSPEHVYDMAITARSNIFTVGCILAELLLRKPLFPVCLPGPLYIREKSVVYDTILGPFPTTMIHDIRRSFKGVFKDENSDCPEYQGLSRTVREFCEETESLKYLILEEYANDIVECMTHLDFTRRVPLADILHHPFFDITSL